MSIGYVIYILHMDIWNWIRAVEPDFKKSNKKPDAKVGYRRLYPTFAVKAAADVLAG